MKFIVTGYSKTGKTILCHALDHLSDYKVYDEIFLTRDRSPKMPIHPDPVIEKIRDENYKNSLYAWYANRYGKHDDIKGLVSKDHVYSFLNQIFNRAENCGFILHHHHIQSVPYISDFIKDFDIKVIHLLRRNELEHVIAVVGNRFFGKPFMMDKNTLYYYLEDIRRRTLDLKNWFPEATEYYYEDMTGGICVSEIDVRKIKHPLGLDILDFLKVSMKKYLSDSMEDNVLNFNDVKRWYGRDQ